MGFSLSLSLFFVVTVFYIVIIDACIMLFRITGLTEEQARFQTISLLTNSGYTTNESELVVEVEQRRRLARRMMMFGYIFSITVISVFVNMMLQLPSSTKEELWPVLIIVGIAFTVFMIVRRIPVVRQAFNAVVEQWGRRWMYGKDGNTIMIDDEYPRGVLASVKLQTLPSIVQGKSVQEWNADDHGVYVLYINRDGEILHRTDVTQYFKPGDLITVFGEMKTIKELFGDVDQEQQKPMKQAPRPMTEQAFIHKQNEEAAKVAARQVREMQKEKDAHPAPEERNPIDVLEQIKGILLGGPAEHTHHAGAQRAMATSGSGSAAPQHNVSVTAKADASTLNGDVRSAAGPPSRNNTAQVEPASTAKSGHEPPNKIK